MSYRTSSIVLLLLSIFYGLTALSFQSEYITYSLGATKYPITLSSLLALLSIYLLVYPDKSDIEKRSLNKINRLALIFIGSLFLYIFLLWMFGYIIATVIYMSILGVMFGGKFYKSFITSIVFSGIVYLFFVSLLKIHLPSGYIFDMLK
jgi:hypothetical protein